MTIVTFEAMPDDEIVKLNSAFARLMEQQSAVEPPGARLDPAAAMSMVADEARLHYVRWEKNGHYRQNARGKLVFGQNAGGFIAPPELAFEAGDD